MELQLGTKVKDAITGFEGVATARTTFLYGCVRVQVEPTELLEGKPVDAQWFDEQRLIEQSTAKTGGPGPVAPSRDCPPR